MLITTAEEHIDFLQNNLLLPIRKILDSSDSVFGFMVMGQAIEILGSYLDNKPMRAQRQSALRFSAALYRLFPSKYSMTNRKNLLYIQLRSILTHTFIPTGNLSLNFGLDTKEKHHLQFVNDVLYLYSENLYSDLEKAVNKLIIMINDNRIKLKKLSTGEINSNPDFQA